MVDRDLRLGFQALIEGIIGPDQLREALAECLPPGGPSLSTILEMRGLASTDQIAELQDRLDRPMGPERTATALSSSLADRETAPHPTGHEATTGEPTARAWSGSDGGDRDRSTGRPSDDGRYERVRLLGSGGLGEVWLARDHHLGREVALKQVREDRSGDDSLVDRFLEEARITSRLEHRGIVPVYDLVEGRDGDRRAPFYSMRPLGGRTLRAAIEEYHRRRLEGVATLLEFRGLLDALTEVCQVVAFAHSRGVLHRDLKGSNVILGDFGEVFVIDWGLAKLSKPASDGEEPSAISRRPDGREDTEPGSILGTPGYIAPELAVGQAADVRSDVYSLGAILYLLLTGRLAYVGTTDHVLREMEQRDPPPPRAPVGESPRALEAICLKAMARAPSGRYDSAEALADDLRRWLADEPVEAYADPTSMRLARWGRKHRSAVLAASAILVSTVFGLSITTALVLAEQGRTLEQRRNAESERFRAEGNLALSREITVDLMKLDYELSPLAGSERGRLRIFDRALETFRQSLNQRPSDPSLRKWTAQIARISANLHRLINDHDAAERSYRLTTTLLESLAAQFPEDGFHRVELALALCDQAQSRLRVGRLGESAALIRRAVGVDESVVAESPGAAGGLRSLASALYSLATVESQMGHPDESAKACRRAIAIYEGLLKPDVSESLSLDLLMMGSCLQALAAAEREAGRTTQAIEAADRGISLMRSFLERERHDNNASHNLARLLLERARAGMAEAGRRPEADLDEAVPIWDELATRFESLPLYRESSALARQVRGAFKGDDKDLEASSRVFEALAREHPDIPAYRANLGRTCLERGRLARVSGQAAPARAFLERAVGLLKGIVEQSPEAGRDRRSLDEAVEEQSLATPSSKP